MGGSGLKLNDESISFLKITSPKPSIIFDMVIRHSYSEQALCVNSIDQRQGAIASNRKVSLCIQFFFFPFLLENWDALIPLSILLAFCIDSADSQDRLCYSHIF